MKYLVFVISIIISCSTPDATETGTSSATEVATNNEITVEITAQDRIYIEDSLVDFSDVQELVYGQLIDYSNLVVKFYGNRQTTYSFYVNVYDEIRAAYMQRRNDVALSEYGVTYSHLLSDTEVNRLEIDKIKLLVPVAIEEKDPTSDIQDPQFPEPDGFVNDFEGLLAGQEEKMLLDIIKAHEKQTTDQIAILTTASIAPYEQIEQYAREIAIHWGVGHKDKDNGILVVVSKNLRLIRIAIGYGLEEHLTDEEAAVIIKKMSPLFKEARFFEGLKTGVEAIIVELSRS